MARTVVRISLIGRSAARCARALYEPLSGYEDNPEDQASGCRPGRVEVSQAAAPLLETCMRRPRFSVRLLVYFPVILEEGVVLRSDRVFGDAAEVANAAESAGGSQRIAEQEIGERNHR